MSASGLVVYTIYARPADNPEGFVVRKWNVRQNPDAAEAFPAPTLDAARRLIPPGLVCIQRHPSDEPQIIESWL